MAALFAVENNAPPTGLPVGIMKVANKRVVGDLAAAPETVNADPEGAGWFAKLKIADPGQIAGLMDRAAYDAFLASL